MDLKAIRAGTLAWLDDPHGERFVERGSYARLDDFIHLAYEDVVREMETASGVWNVYPTPITLTVVTTQREYPLTPTQSGVTVRRPLRARRTETRGYTPLLMKPWTQADSAVREPLPRLGTLTPDRLYYFRGSDGVFYVGFVEPEPTSQTVEVFFIPGIVPLGSASDEPTQVPFEWHSLIPLGAAVFGKISVKRDHRDLTALYEHRRSRMTADLDRGVNPGGARPI